MGECDPHLENQEQILETPETRHIIEADQFTPEFIDAICCRAEYYKGQIEAGLKVEEMLFNTRMLNVFYEPSTRTRFSFDMAAKRLGMEVLTTESASHFSSAAKGETLEDTIRVFAEYRPDVIVLRHPEDDSAERAAAVSDVPILNAGAGKGEHPTQAMLDVFTIKEKLGRLENLNVIIGGDLKHGRTAKSLALLLSKYENNHLVFISPESMQMTEDVKQKLSATGMSFTKTDELAPFLPDADVIYWTRTQKERGAVDDSSKFVLGSEELALMKQDAIIMHPLPRIDEITTDVDSDPRAIYFEQAGNGQYVRMALLEWAVRGRVRNFPQFRP